MPGLSDCFSFMSYEETLNCVLAACLNSILARDANGDGVMDRDSDRCAGGSEITTYDSLDISLGQARNNLYLAVKAWSAFICVDGPYGELVRVLKRHLDKVLVPGVCLDSGSGGWKLSSTSRNTWLSKIFLNQYVAENVLGFDDERTKRDTVHARWLRTGSADYAATDQVDSSTGADLGSRLYPRLVTSILWLEKG
jgi:hypothetical protein